MFARISAFVIWSLVAATAVFWALRFAVSSPPTPAHAVPVDRSAPLRGDLARLFGAPPVVIAAAEAPAPEAASRYRLIGVMAPKSRPDNAAGRYGLALIAVDGKPAKAFAVGARLDSDLVLQSVGMRTASLGSAQGGRSVLLELPMLAQPATGVLPAPGAPAPMAAPAPAPMLQPAPVFARPPAQLPVVAAPAPAMQPAAPPVMQPPAPPVMQPAPPPGIPGMAQPPPNPTDNFRSQ